MTVTSCGLHCLKIQHIGVRVGETVILDDVNLHAHCGELTAIIGAQRRGQVHIAQGDSGGNPSHRDGGIQRAYGRRAGA